MKKNRTLAKKIASDLLTGANPEKGQRLQIKLTPRIDGGDERDGGGYCESALIDIIESHLDENK